MGCSSSASSASTPYKLSQKPRVWLISGGPGSKKGKICQYMIRDFKMKYLSAHDILQFERQRNGPDAQIIKQLIQQNKKFPSDLVAKLVKKAIASCGVRKFLIDDFPRNQDDLKQFDNIISAKDITIEKFIYISVPKDFMIQSGIQAKTNQKTTPQQKQQIMTMVTKIVQEYMDNITIVARQFENRKMIWKFNATEGPQQAYSNIKNRFSQIGLTGFDSVTVFLSHFDDNKYQSMYCDDLCRKYGLLYYNITDLINEAKQKKLDDANYIKNCEKENIQLSPEFLISLIRKKFQKQDFNGKFLISGFPRNLSDAQQWERKFGWQTDVRGYLNFEVPEEQFKPLFEKYQLSFNPTLKKQELQKQYKKYQENQIELCKHYNQKQKLLKLNCNQQAQVFKKTFAFFEKNVCYPRRNMKPQMQIVFMSTICNDGNLFTDYLFRDYKVKVVNFSMLMQEKIKEGGLYAQLIDSYNKTGKPLPGTLASKILMENLLTITEGKVIVKGFPNSKQQIACWEQEVGQCLKVTHIIYFQTDKKYITQMVRKGLKENKIIGPQGEIISGILRNSQQLQKKLISSEWSHSKIRNEDSFQISMKFLTKDLQNGGFLKNSK